MDGYCAIQCGRNRKGRGVICYVTNKICYNNKNCISNEIENIFIELLIPKTKPITVGIIYKPPDQTRFLEILSDSLNSLNMLSEEWHILGDLNINLYQNGSTLGQENKKIIKAANKILSETKKYLEFCKTFGLKQLIKSPTRVTPNTSTLIDHILTNTNEKITQCGLINIGLSDRQMIFCTKKIKKEKVGGHEQISVRSFKIYSVDKYEKALGKVKFPNYEKYHNINKAYNDFFQKLIELVDNIAPLKTARIKNTSNEWSLCEMCPNTEFFPVRIFLHSD